VVARVNGVAITMTDVNAALGLGIVAPPTAGDTLAVATAQLIERQLMLAEVVRFSEPEPDESAVDREAMRLRARAGAALDRLVDSTGLDDRRIREIARDTLRLQGYLNQRFGTTVQVSDDEVERYYRTHPDEFLRDGVVLTFDEAEVLARPRAAAARREALIAQWLRDLRMQADISTPQPRP
jgi:hypothetical protein